MGRGSWRAITGEQTPQQIALELLHEITQPGLRDIRVEFRGVETAAVYPDRLPNIAAGTQQILVGRYLPDAKRSQGEVIVTDTLRHLLRKEEGHWRIYTDQRISTYREGRFGEQSPNIQLEVPGKLPTEGDYEITVSVQHDPDKNYQVMVGNYPEDPEFLPPPDIVTELPENGILTANLSRNPKGWSEMVRITVIVEDQEGSWIGATTVSKFIPGLPQGKEDEEDQAVI